MGVLALLSAKGSPGTTTTALLLAALWPAPVLLVDADAEGGDVALRLRREDGAPVDRSRGLLSLLPLARRELQPAVLPEHAQVLRGGVEVLAGLSGPGQAGAAGHLWSNLADAFGRTVDRDVLVDCGRVSPSRGRNWCGSSRRLSRSARPSNRTSRGTRASTSPRSKRSKPGRRSRSSRSRRTRSPGSSPK